MSSAALSTGIVERTSSNAADRQPARTNQRREIRPLDHLHRQKTDSTRFFDRVQRDDVRMVETRYGLGFTLEAREALRRRGQRFGEQLDGDVAVQTRVVGTINLAHPSRAERRKDFVESEPGSGGERHGEDSSSCPIGYQSATKPSELSRTQDNSPSSPGSFFLWLRSAEYC